ncbi:MAG: TRAM domain-containing protein, partial [Anaerococcus sp.]|nr:TRAM domain-containing protein [Anaerococcus sp.]
TGRTDTFKLVHVKAPKELIGEIVKVKITDHTSFTISGDLVN